MPTAFPYKTSGVGIGDRWLVTCCGEASVFWRFTADVCGGQKTVACTYLQWDWPYRWARGTVHHQFYFMATFSFPIYSKTRSNDNIIIRQEHETERGQKKDKKTPHPPPPSDAPRPEEGGCPGSSLPSLSCLPFTQRLSSSRRIFCLPAEELHVY